MIDRRRRLVRAAAGALLLAVFPAAALLPPPAPGPPGYSVCLAYTLTGRPCIFCGLTRAFIAAAHGRFAPAAQFHPAWWLAAALVAWLGALCLWDAATGADRLRPWLVFWKRHGAALAGLVVVLSLVRMWLAGPG